MQPLEIFQNRDVKWCICPSFWVYLYEFFDVKLHFLEILNSATRFQCINEGCWIHEPRLAHLLTDGMWWTRNAWHEAYTYNCITVASTWVKSELTSTYISMTQLLLGQYTISPRSPRVLFRHSVHCLGSCIGWSVFTKVEEIRTKAKMKKKRKDILEKMKCKKWRASAEIFFAFKSTKPQITHIF